MKMIFVKILMLVLSIHNVHCLQRNNQPHIILIVADDLGWNDVSWHNQGVQTPNLNDLALTGVRLNRSYVLHVCTPTRAALLTGRYPFTIGRQKHTLEPLEPTGLTLNATLLPQALKAAGYDTHAVGKWHLGYCSWAYTPTYRGFDTFFGFYTGSEHYWNHRKHVQQSSSHNRFSKEDIDRYQHINNRKLHTYLDLRNNTKPDQTQDGKYSAHMFASYVENLLRSRNPADPMFLYLPFQSVHGPLMVPMKYIKPYKHIQNVARRKYLGMVSALDDAVGKIVRGLKTTGHYQNSVIVFTTDNGGQCLYGGNNWPLKGKKSTLWEGGTRGVAFVHSPLLPNPGTVSDELIHVTDWFPTLAGLAVSEAPAITDGFDQWKAISGLESSPRKKMVYNIDIYNEIIASVRIGDMKLLVGHHGNNNWFQPNEMKKPRKDSLYFKKFHSKQRKYLTSKNKNPRNIKDSTLREYSSFKARKPKVENQLPVGEVSIATWGFMLEKYFRGSDWLKARLHALKILKNDTQIRLYNVIDDPEERKDLCLDSVDEVKNLLEFMLEEISSRYIPPDLKSRDHKGHPKRWNNVFSPGWCETK